MKSAILVSAILGALFATRGKKSISNPFIAFNCVWIVVAIFINIGNVHIYEPNSIALNCVLVGILGFNIAQIMPKITIERLRIGLFWRDQYEINYHLVFILSFIVMLLSVGSTISAIHAILSGHNFGDIRNDYYTIASGESVYMYYLRNYLISPLRYVVIIPTIIGILKKDKISRMLVFNTVLIIIMQVVTSGGRYILMNTIFMIVCGFSLFADKERITWKQKVGLFFIVVLFSYMIIFLTNDRATQRTINMTVSERLYETIYSYFAGSVTYLGKVMETFPDIVGSTFGLNFCTGFIRPFFALLTFVNLLPFPDVFNVIGTYACEVLKIGPATYYNAMPTIFGYFYIDGGLIMVFLESMLFGYICKRLYIRSQTGNLLMSAFYILIFMQICNSSTRWFFFSSDYSLAFLYLNLVIKKAIAVGGVITLLIVKALFEKINTKNIIKDLEIIRRGIKYCLYAISYTRKCEVIA